LKVWKPGTTPHIQRWIEHGRPWLFSESEELKAQLVLHETPDPDGDIRKNLKEMPVFVIDDEGIIDPDDGISLVRREDGYDWLYVHIADVTRYVRRGSEF